MSKARQRWGAAVFERVFGRTVQQCVAAGWVDGAKLHVDTSLVAANASREAVIKGTPAWIAALKAAYQATEKKLDELAPPTRTRRGGGKAVDGLFPPRQVVAFVAAS